jgi:hypothetical protein
MKYREHDTQIVPYELLATNSSICTTPTVITRWIYTYRSDTTKAVHACLHVDLIVLDPFYYVLQPAVNNIINEYILTCVETANIVIKT